MGSFILFQDGNPILIDIGSGTYTSQTFGSHRYELFYMQSQYHNCPTINDVQQGHDGTYSSHNTTLNQLPNNQGFHFQSDIAGAYLATAHVNHWIRSIQFNQSSNVIQLDDRFELNQQITSQKLNFIIYREVVIDKTDYGLHLHQPDNKVNLRMELDWNMVQMNVEEKSLEGDYHQTQFWGDYVKRLILTMVNHSGELNGHFSVRFVAAK